MLNATMCTLPLHCLQLMLWYAIAGALRVLASVLVAGAGDLKPALTIALNNILQPVRDHFEKDAGAAALLKKVKVS